MAGPLSQFPSQDERRAAAISSVLGIAVFTISIPLALWRPDFAQYSWLALLLVGRLGRRTR